MLIQAVYLQCNLQTDYIVTLKITAPWSHWVLPLTLQYTLFTDLKCRFVDIALQMMIGIGSHNYVVFNKTVRLRKWTIIEIKIIWQLVFIENKILHIMSFNSVFSFSFTLRFLNKYFENILFLNKCTFRKNKQRINDILYCFNKLNRTYQNFHFILRFVNSAYKTAQNKQLI